MAEVRLVGKIKKLVLPNCIFVYNVKYRILYKTFHEIYIN